MDRLNKKDSITHPGLPILACVLGQGGSGQSPGGAAQEASEEERTGKKPPGKQRRIAGDFFRFFFGGRVEQKSGFGGM